MTGTPQRSARGIQRGWAHESSPFHAGEQQVQSLIGVREQVERAGRNMIREEMPDQHRELFQMLPMLVVGSVDVNGRLWASLLAGEPGFIVSPDAKTLRITADPLPGDPLLQNLRAGAPLGLVGIQLETRRRNRANGHITARDAHSFTVNVEQSFGNCKQYIQAREPTFVPELRGTVGSIAVEGPRLSTRATALLSHTDTFFIATASAAASNGTGSEGVDVSHRGGRPGFVRVKEDGTASSSALAFPDFSGNFMFNTLGNLQVNPRAGIVCADFETGDVLSITGSAHVIWDGPAVAAFPGAERLVIFEPESGVFLEHALPLRFTSAVPSPYLADTGIWAEAALR